MTKLQPMWAHQARAVAEARQQFRDGSSAICIVAPTAAGKTRIGVEFALAAIRKGGRVLWLAHRRELVQQARNKLPRNSGITVATVQDLAATGRRPPCDVAVLDEAHHYVADEWGDVANDYRGAALLGLTATPERADGRALGDLFQTMVVAAQYSELLAAGRIVDCDVFAPAKRGGLAMPTPEAVRRFASGRQSIVFCDNVASATKGAMMTDGAELITGKTPGRVRDIIVGRFLNGTTRHLFNVYCLTEGFDAPRASVCVLGSNVSHASGFLQRVGRILRACEGKDRAIVVDLCGSILEHGHPTEDREYSLTGKPIGRKKADPLWQCKACGWCHPGAPPDRTCPSCGAVLPEPESIRLERRRVERMARNALASPATKEKEYAELKAKGERKGYKPGWAKAVYFSRFHQWPRD